MKLDNGKITFLVNSDYTEITIEDGDANTLLAHIKLTPEQLSLILSRMGSVRCEITTGPIERIGKTHECKTFEFENPYTQSELPLACAEALLKEGMHEWVSDNHYGSKNSLFKKDGKNYARTTIRRWINK